MPFAPFANRERIVSHSLDEHVLAERWLSASILDYNVHGTGVLANRASVELPLLSTGQLRAGSEPVSGSSASTTGGFSRWNELPQSSRFCSCSWWSGVASRSSRCGALCESETRFPVVDREHCRTTG